MSDCLTKNKFLSKTKQISEKQLRNLKSRLNFDIRGIKIKKIFFFLNFGQSLGIYHLK